MDDPLTTSQKVFAIPELLLLIFGLLPSCCQWHYSTSDDGEGTHSYLERYDFTRYMLVNKTWCAVAAHFAWKQCGYGRYELRSGRQNLQTWPQVSDLVKLVSSPHRMQYYANHIETLHIGDNADTEEFLSSIETTKAIMTDQSIAFP